MSERILVIAAHPDDEVLGMGGSIAKFSSEGKEVHLLIVTDGSSSQYASAENLAEIIESKKSETAKAKKILGISSVTYGGLPDMRLDTIPHIEINRVIEDTINHIEPDTVFTHFWGDINKDHQCIYESTLVASRPISGQKIKEIYCYSVPSSTEWNQHRAETIFTPTLFNEIVEYKEKKYQAMEAYSTELREYPHPRSIQHLRELDKAVGLQVGLKESESFVFVRVIRN